MDSLATLAAQLQAALVSGLSGPSYPRVGPFVVLLDADSDNPFRNYAAPAAADPPSAADVAALLELFAARHRRPRIEYVEPAPGLTAALTAAGFIVLRRLPLLVLGEAGALDVAPVDGVEVGRAGDADLLGAAEVQVTAYGDSEPAEVSAQRLHRLITRGGAVAVARETASGRIVGAALHATPAGGFAEIAAVAVDAAWRRRGIGAAVSAEITRTAHATGARPFLQAEGDREAVMYGRIGYEHCGSLALAEVPHDS